MKSKPAFVLMLLLLAGCTTKPASTPAIETGGKSGDGSVLRVGLLADPPSLDPGVTTDTYTAEMLQQCFEGLTRANEKNEIEPALAERWETSADGLTWTFFLRKGVQFHNGKPLTASDVKFSWEHALNPKTKSSVALNYLDGVVGAKEVSLGKRPDLSGVEIINDTTLRIKLDRPRAYFPSMLTYPSNFVLCRDAVEKAGGVVNQSAFIGTGPFALVDYTQGRQVTFQANATYWGGKPKIARLEFPVVLDPTTAYDKYVAGGLDVVETDTKRYAQDRDAGRLKDDYHIGPLGRVIYIAMHPVAQPAFANPKVRRAIALAIDKTQIVKDAHKNVGKAAYGFVPTDLPNAGPEPPPLPYDPAQAKRLLAEAGYPDGKGFPSVALHYLQTDADSALLSQIVVENLKNNLGLNFTIVPVELGQLISDANAGKLGMHTIGWVADYADPQDFLSTLFASDSPLNRFAYKNARFDAACRKADSTTDPAVRAKNYAEANRILMEDVGVLPTSYVPRLFLVKPNVQGWRVNLSNPLPHAQVVKN